MKTLLSLIMLFVSAALNLYAEPFKWTQTNGPTGGAFGRVVRDTKGNAYVAYWDGRLYKNLHGTTTWRYVKDDVYALMIDKYDNFYIKVFSDGSLNLFDSELNFIKKIREDKAFYYSVLTANAKGGVYVGIDNGNNSEKGLYYSSDKGDTWEKIRDIAPSTLAFDSTDAALFVLDWNYFGFTRDNWKSTETRSINPTKPQKKPAALEYNFKYNTWIAQGIDSSMYISSDMGKSWIKAIPDLKTYHYPIVVDADGKTYIYCHPYMWVSNDGGFNWEKLFTSKYGISSFILRDKEIICGSYNNLLRYEFSSKKLDYFNDSLICSFINDIEGDNEGRIYATSHGKLCSTPDGGNNWEYAALGNINPDWFTRLAFSKTGNIFAMGNSATLKSSDKGVTWNHVFKITDKDSAYVDFLHLDSLDRLYVLSKGIYYSDDDGKTWNQLNIPNFSYAYNYSMATFEDKLSLIINGVNGDTILYSEDRGLTFRELPIITHKSVNISAEFNSKGWFYCILNDYNQPDSLFISKDGCKTFTSSQIPLPYVSKIAFDKNDYLYALSGETYSMTNHFARTTDNGLSWEYIVDTNNIKLRANDIYFDDKNQAFLGTVRDGVWKADVIKGIPLENKSNQLSLEISPNPASERATITLGKDEGPAEITIYNQLGEIVFQTRHSEQTREIEIHVAEFPQGAYFVKVSAGGVITTGKFAVVR